jgi:hypothetical protein
MVRRNEAKGARGGMQDSGYSNGGTRPRSCFPRTGHSAPLLITSLHFALRDGVSQHWQEHSPRISPHTRSPVALVSALDSGHAPTLLLTAD